MLLFVGLQTDGRGQAGLPQAVLMAHGVAQSHRQVALRLAQGGRSRATVTGRVASLQTLLGPPVLQGCALPGSAAIAVEGRCVC